MKQVITFLLLLTVHASFGQQDFVSQSSTLAQSRLKALLKTADQQDLLFPRTIDKTGKVKSINMYDWTPGFFPGALWYAYELTGDDSLKKAAARWTEKLEPLKTFTGHHDLGFMVYCSFGNAEKLASKPTYKDILIQSARSLCTRFNKTTGAIKSWNTFKPFEGDTTYHFPVIIDNMMNLELLFYASKVSGDPYYRNVAVKHAETTLKNHFRKDFSSYHVICYDTLTGKVVARKTAQGYANNSAWSRGQSWGLYGYTMVYRETRDKRFLKIAEQMADYLLGHPNLPSDLIPYWDYNANEKGFIPGPRSKAQMHPVLFRDASAGAIMASALLELSQFIPAKKDKYFKAAEKMLHSLSGPAYTAKAGTNGDFILMHSVGSIPGDSEVDVPLNYADYYFLEGLSRYKRLKEGKDIL